MRLPSEMTAGQIAGLIGGRLEGNPDVKVNSVAMSPIDAEEGQIAFVYEQKLLKKLPQCKASVVIVPEGTKSHQTLILVKRANLAIQRILTALQPKRYLPDRGVHPTAVIDPSAQVAESAAIGPYVVIGPKCKIGERTTIMAGTILGGEVTVGANCLIYPGCLIADYVKIGEKVILQQGAVIGSDGFGYVAERPSNMEIRMAGGKELSDEPNALLKIPQIGTVEIGDEVEIGSCATIDRATMGATKIGKGTKIDNLVMVAHNVRVGREVIIVGQSGIGGSCRLDDRAIVAGHVAIADHMHIGKDAIIQGKAGVMKDVEEGDVQQGIPAIPMKQFFREIAHLRKLPEMASELKAMRNRIEQLEKQLQERQLIKK